MIFLNYGNGRNRKVINLCNANMTDDLKQTLLGFHAFTGNDYVSSFFTKEKAASWNMFQNEGFIKGFQEFGLSWKILQELCEL